MYSNWQQICRIVLLIILSTSPCGADSNRRDDKIEVITDFTYKMGHADSKEIAKALALFGAKLKAVDMAAKYLTHKGLLEHYQKKQGEIFCLATNEITSFTLEEKFYPEASSYYVKIKSEVKSTDFIKAQIKDLDREKEESGFSYSEEMEQHVAQVIDPGAELSRAYRYIRQEQWRIAIIYLNQLGKKYPSWGDVSLAKAVAFYGMDAIDKMADSLKDACALNNQTACSELESFFSTR